KSSAPNSAATPLMPTSAPLSASQYYPNPNMPPGPAPAPLPFGFPPMNGFIPPQMPPHLQQLFQQSQHQQFLNGLPQFLTPQNFGNQFQKFQSAHLPPHLLLGPPGPLPVHPPSSAAFMSHQHGNGNVINMAPNAHDLKRPSFIRNQGETKELLSILNKPKQPSKKSEEDVNVGGSTEVKSSNGSGNDYSKGLLALLSKKKEDPAETVETSKQQQDQEQPVKTEPVPLQLGSPMQEKPKPKPKLRMLKREPTNSETNQPQSQPQSKSILSPSPSASLLDLLKPRSSTTTPAPMATTDLPSLESDLSTLQQRIDEDYENDKSIHSPFLNEDTFSPRSTSNGSDAGAGAGGRKLKMLKRGETLDSALSNNSASENGTADATVAYTASLGKAKYAEFDNQSVVSTIQFSDNDENEDELEEVEADSSAVDFKNERDDQNDNIEEEIIEEDGEDDDDEEDEDEDEYEQFESYDEDEEAFVENERLKEFDSDEEQGEDLEYEDGAEEEYNYTENDNDDDDDDDDDHFVDSSEAYYNEHINEESTQQDKAVEYEAEPEPETATATPVVPNPPVEQAKPKFQLLGAKKSSPAPGLLSLLQGNGETDATKPKPLSLDDIESSLTPTASPQVQPVPTSDSSNAKNEIFGLFNKPSPQQKLSSAQSTKFATPVNDPSSSLLDLLHKKVQVPTEAASESPKQQQQPVFLEDIENQQQQRPASALSYAGSSLTNSRPPMAPSAPTKLKITQAPLDVSDLEKSIPTFSNSPMIKHVQPQPQQQQQFQNSPMMQYQPSPAPVAASPAVIGFPPTPVPFMNSPVPQFQQLQPQPHQFNQSSFPGYQQLPQSPFQQHQHMSFQQQQQPSPAPMSAGGMVPNAPGQFPVPFGGQHPHPFQNHTMVPQQQQQQQQPSFHNNIGLQMNGNAAQIQTAFVATLATTATSASGETILAANPPLIKPKFTVVRPSNSSSSNSMALSFPIISISFKLASIPNSGYPEWLALPLTVNLNPYPPLWPTPRVNSVGSPNTAYSHSAV
ncbi:hypothetical protein WICPIJ_007830, partial [Wickerhamomyces pijperi]